MGIRSETGYVNIGTDEVGYAKFGSGSKAFVILPGISLTNILGSAESIASAYSMFAERFTVWVFDRRKNMPEGYTVEGMAEDTASAMKAAGISDAYLFGTSQGGMILQYLAARHPELVHKAILGSTSAKLTEKNTASILRWSELAKKRDLDTLCGEFADCVYSADFLARYRDAIIEFGKLASPEDVERFRIMAEACRGLDTSDELGKIKCPVFVIGSESDNVLGGAASHEIAEKLGCKLFMYEGYGHAVYDEAPDYKQKIWDFFNEED